MRHRAIDTRWINTRARDDREVRGACKRLIALGQPEERVKQFPALRILLLDDKSAFEVWRDDGLKSMSLPYWQAGSARSVKPRLRQEQYLALLCRVEA